MDTPWYFWAVIAASGVVLVPLTVSELVYRARRRRRLKAWWRGRD